jgi:hypothetical protein
MGVSEILVGAAERRPQTGPRVFRVGAATA